MVGATPQETARLAMARQDWRAAADAWRSCLEQYPERVAPNWLADLAKAQSELGDDAGAETTLLHCRERFPGFAPAAAALAALFRRTGRHADAVAAWEAALRDFPDRAVPAWQIGLAGSLRALGRDAAAEAVLDAMAARFPTSAAAMSRRAEKAARAEDWREALQRWNQCLETHPPRPDWLNGQALALLRLGQPAEAIAVLEDAIQKFPDSAPLRLRLATAAGEIGRSEQMLAGYAGAIARFADRVTPDWLAGEARALLIGGRFEAAQQAIAALDARFPESPLVCRLALQHAQLRAQGLSVLAVLLEEGIRRFPNDRLLLSEHVHVLLASGRPEEADAMAAQLEAGGDDHLAWISRWRVELDRDGEAALRERVEAALAGQVLAANTAAAVGRFLLALWSAWAPALTEALLRDAVGRYPGNITLRGLHAKALIALRRDDAALAVIEGLPHAVETQDVLELRAWAQWRAGALAPAQEIWGRILSRYPFPAVRGAEPVLELVNAPPGTEAASGVTAYLNVKNEMLHLPEFLRHHRAIGVRRFVVVDNMSSDAAPAYLAAQPDVILYRTGDAFQTSSAGMRWVNALRERHGGGGWCLYADADETFIYPGWEQAKLDRLTEYLDREGADALGGFMLDVYPARLGAERAAYKFYDADYQWIGQRRPPYVQPVGGVRGRLFGVNEYLHKTPLLRHGPGVYIDSHGTTPVRLSGVTGMLLHYKLLNLEERYRPAVPGIGGNPFMADRAPELMRRHVRYAARMAAVMEADLRAPGVTEEVADSMTMVDRGLMAAPAAFRAWLQGET